MDLRRHLSEVTVDIPVVSPGRCVHARLEVASCTRCVTACPRGAWVLDDEQLAIDTHLCDGCGICVAHCPEAALSQRSGALPPLNASGEVRLRCHRKAAETLEADVFCVNAVSLRQIAYLHGRGLRQVYLDTDDCETCDYRDDQGLTARVDDLNQVLTRRGLQPIRVSRPPERTPTDKGDGLSLSRRGFLHRLTRAIAGPVDDTEPVPDDPPGGYLPEARLGDLALCVPQIDPDRCNGCDACTRVCAHGALALAPDAAAYSVRADLCTGCALCTDVCEKGAIRIDEGALVDQRSVPLETGVCRACGIRFHRPAKTGGPGERCQICEQVNHRRNLFQVLGPV